MQDGLTLVRGGFKPPLQVTPKHQLGGDEDMAGILPTLHELYDKRRLDGSKGLAVEREHKTQESNFGGGAVPLISPLQLRLHTATSITITYCYKYYYYILLQVLLLHTATSITITYCYKHYYYILLQVLLLHTATSITITYCYKYYYYILLQVLLLHTATSITLTITITNDINSISINSLELKVCCFFVVVFSH